MRIATISLNQVWEDKDSNIKRIKHIMQDVSSHNPDMVIFPEMTLTGFTMNAECMAEEMSNSLTIDFFKSLSRKYHVACVFGIILRTKDKPTNNIVVVSDEGEMLAQYAKMHPFSYSGENSYYSKGNNAVCFSWQGHRIGLTICYDLRFPELYQSLSRQCDTIINIANWPARRVNDWNLLLHARALENQSYVLGVNRTGVDAKGLEYVKSTIVVNPTGEDVIPVSIGDEIDLFDIDKDAVEAYRKSFPVKDDRRIDLYKQIL